MSYIYIDDQLTTEHKICCTDRGFRFGDGLFETIRIYNYSTYLWHYHMYRMCNALQRLKIKGIDIDKITLRAKELIAINRVKSGILRIIISRGLKGSGYMPDINALPIVTLTTVQDMYSPTQPVKILLSKIRKPTDYILSDIKSLSAGHYALAKMEARENNCFDSLLLNSENHIAEVSSGNIFWFKEDLLYTPAVECGILPGVTRRRIIALSPYRIVTVKSTIQELLQAEEVFLTNVSWLALPVNHLVLTHNSQKYFPQTIRVKKIKELLIRDMKTQCN